MKCPVCKDVTLLMSEKKGVEIDYCPECRGIWLDRGELEKIMEKEDTYINKEKALDYLHHSALKAVTSDNQELSDATKLVKDFENPNIPEENLRAGNAVLTDSDLSAANDPASKLLGKSTRTARQRREFAEREHGRAVVRVRELSEKLHLDNVDIVTDTSTLQGKRSKGKGFFNPRTGRITIVIPNQTSVFDAEQTLLHEAVAHYGLRQLFGEHFDTFLDNVYANADEDVRREIAELAINKYGYDFRTALSRFAKARPDLRIVTGLPIGHGARRETLPVGAELRLSSDGRVVTLSK